MPCAQIARDGRRAIPQGGGGGPPSKNALGAFPQAFWAILNGPPCTTSARRVASFSAASAPRSSRLARRIFISPRKIFAPARQHKVERLCCRELPGVDGDCALSFRPRTQKGHGGKIQMSEYALFHSDLGRPSRAQFGRSPPYNCIINHIINARRDIPSFLQAQ